MTIHESIGQRVGELDARQQKALLSFLETLERSSPGKRRKKRATRKAEITAAVRGIAGMWKDRKDLPKNPVKAVKVLRQQMISRRRNG